MMRCDAVRCGGGLCAAPLLNPLCIAAAIPQEDATLRNRVSVPNSKRAKRDDMSEMAALIHRIN